MKKPPRADVEYGIGGQVYFYRVHKSGRSKLPGARHAKPKESACWTGPATVVANLGLGIVWVSWRNSLVEVLVEQLRPAAEEERLGENRGGGDCASAGED